MCWNFLSDDEVIPPQRQGMNENFKPFIYVAQEVHIRKLNKF